MSRFRSQVALAATILVTAVAAQEPPPPDEQLSPLDQPLTLHLSGENATVGAVLDALPASLSRIYDSRVPALTGFEIDVHELPAWQVLEALELVVPGLIVNIHDSLVVLGYDPPGAIAPPFPRDRVLFDSSLELPDDLPPEREGDPADDSWLEDRRMTLADFYFTSALAAFDRGETELAVTMLHRAMKDAPDREFKLEPRYQKLLEQAEGR